MTHPEYPFHPLANTLPLLDGVEFDEMVASIKTHGLRDPITLHDGQILDGRNRYRACRAAGVEPLFEILEVEDGQPLTQDMLAALVYDRNVLRRQLTPSQRAIAAGHLLNHSGLPRNPERLADYATKAGVSARTMQDAAMVAARAPDNVVRLVERGEASVSRAADVVRGKISADDLLPKPRTAGRPVGNMHVQRLRNVMEAFEHLRTGKTARGESVAGQIIKHWPAGDPAAVKTIGEMATFLRSLARELEEVERHASASAVA